MRQRWFSKRALLLHLEVAIVAPGCVAAGWWQATRALAGNGLSWFYSVEWPVFAILAIIGWWYLIHEDPEAYRARKSKDREGAADVVLSGASAEEMTTLASAARMTVGLTVARVAKAMALLVGIELALGIVALIYVPLGRPSELVPTKGVAAYLAHSLIGILLSFGAVALLVRVRSSTRNARLSGWIGFVGITLAATGGVASAVHPIRVVGVGFMAIGSIVAGFGYLIPTFEKLS